ncbi:MAG TPA: DUF72 domain-containing protein [Acidimicrobiales bacterium]|nr:DUF72 domain-containing protein [Acidimicrobiales bacterium]
MAQVRVGTSGWSYPEWVGPFYPAGTSPARMLAVYAASFDTVEAHATYRRLPSAAALERWVDAVPPDFRFATKAHMGITHRRDLDGVESRVDAFLAAVAALGPTRGPVLFSLPHQRPDLGRLDRILSALGNRATAAFDLGPAWHRPDVLDRLDAAGATLVITDSPSLPSVGPLAYVRLRKGDYPPADLDLWAERVAKVVAEDRDAYVFFKHDDAATGPRLAQELRSRG